MSVQKVSIQIDSMPRNHGISSDVAAVFLDEDWQTMVMVTDPKLARAAAEAFNAAADELEALK